MSTPFKDAIIAVFDLILAICRDSHPDTPLARSEHRLKGVGEWDEVLAALDPNSYAALLLIRVHNEGKEECDDGSFRLSLAPDRADIHICDGGCSVPRDPSPASPMESTKMMLENGEFIEVLHRNTICREDGIAAIRYWMECRGKLPRLSWSPS
jgi:hypothetical protein